MRNENLRMVCRELGFDRVSTVISSGSIVFDDARVDRAARRQSSRLHGQGA